MSLFSTILGWFGLHKEKRKADFYADQKDTCWYWRKDVLKVYIPDVGYTEIKEAALQWSEAVSVPRLELIPYGHPDEADIVVAMEDAVARGGVTTRVPVKGKNREIAWVKISIAKHEKGKRLLGIALHEIGHGLGLTHDGAPKGDVMHPDAKATSISDADKLTLRKIYENRPPAV